nr:acyltransferase family protein [Sphingomonas sp. R-74633]
MKYRPEIDGLRALAVVPVVIFHASKDLLGGGFVGVDVFFVISGFLITSIILSDINFGKFSLITFYERRVRRIIPALYMMLLALFIVGFVSFDPDHLFAAAKEILATTFFASNILFLRQADYFDSESILKPLLNTWSLSVEEQFYVLFPPLLFVITRYWRRGLEPVLWFLFVVSLAFSIGLQQVNPDANFYLPFGRAWELMTGSLLAVGAVPAIQRPTTRSILALLGVVLIGIAMFTYTDRTSFPGLAAIPPCLGAALFIHCAQNTGVGRLFSMRPFVFIGLISYSLYLWHWPLLSIARYLTLGDLTLPHASGVVVLAVVVAYLSTRFVEKPFRSKALSRNKLFTIGFVATLAVIALCAGTLATHGVVSRANAAPEQAQQIAKESSAFGASPCLVQGSTLPVSGQCRIGDPSRPVNALLLGDSHAGQLAPLFEAEAVRNGLSMARFTKARCLPVVTGRFEPADPIQKGCSAFNAAVLDYIARNSELKMVFLAARWDIYADGTIRAGPASGKWVGDPRSYVAGQLASFAQAMRARGIAVVVFGQAPIPMSDPASCLKAAAFNGRSNAKCLTFDIGRVAAIDREVNASILGQLRGSATVLPLFDLYCAGQRCDAARGGVMLFMDKAHLSAAGALAISARLQQVFDRLRPASAGPGADKGN